MWRSSRSKLSLERIASDDAKDLEGLVWCKSCEIRAGSLLSEAVAHGYKRGHQAEREVVLEN